MELSKEEFRVDLKDDFLHFFKWIQRENNIQTNVDVFRYALQTTYEIESAGDQLKVFFSSSTEALIENFLKRKDVRLRYNVETPSQFVKRAVEMLIEKTERFVSTRSILHWDVRNSLVNDEKEVAIAFKACQAESQTSEVTIDELLAKLGWRDGKYLEEILERFVAQDLVELEVIGMKKYFHAKVSEY